MCSDLKEIRFNKRFYKFAQYGQFIHKNSSKKFVKNTKINAIER